jgi:hypothetical protein
MNNINFEEIWDNSNQLDLLETQKFCLRAEEFNAIREEQKEKFELIELLHSNHVINKGYDVLDIRCRTEYGEI